MSEEMKKLKVGDDEFEIVDEKARNELDTHDDDISSIKNFLQSLGRKVLAMTGTLKEMDKSMDSLNTKALCKIMSISNTYESDVLTAKHMNIGIGSPVNYISVDLLESDKTNYGTIKYVRGWGIGRYKLYLLNSNSWDSAVDTSVAEVKLYFDGVEKSPSELKVDDTFTSLVIFKRMSSGKVYIHEIDSTGLKLFILTDVADYQRSELHVSSTSNWERLYDGGELAIYAVRASGAQYGKTVTIRSDTSWVSGKWFKSEIHW